MKVEVTKTTQLGNALLERPDKEMYYLLIGDAPERIIINVGKATYEGVEKLIKAEIEPKTKTK